MFELLVIDDDEGFRGGLAEALRENGYDVREAASLREGLELAEKRVPHLLLLDFALPDGNGLELLRYLRGRSSFRNVPVIMLSAHVRRDLVSNAAMLGVGAYLIKSTFSLQDLFGRLEARLGAVSPAGNPGGKLEAGGRAGRPAPVQSLPVFDPSDFLRSVELRSFPGAVADVMALAENPQASLSDLEKVLRRDPALSARILSASQSAALMRRSPTRSIEEALQVLGMAEVVRLVAVGSVLGKDELAQPWAKDLRLVWSHSIATGFLSQRLHEVKDEAFGFLVGLLHELPELLAILHLGEGWDPIRNKGIQTGWSVTSALGEAFKSPFGRLAREVLIRMRLPASLSAALRELHDAEDGIVNGRSSARIVQLAHHLSGVVERPGSMLSLVSPVRKTELSQFRSTDNLAAEISDLQQNVEAWEKLTGLGQDRSSLVASTASRVLYYRDDLFAQPDPLEALLRRSGEVKRVMDPLDLEEHADLKVVLAEPGSDAWEFSARLRGRVMVLHTNRADRPPGKTVRVVRMPLSEARMEEVFREV
ncbi:MAG: HDOD domain-containing protein [Fibrobacteria bacterium]|nr:HDOD domain-containing protein [Fibrobacteria bacterium]